MSAKKRSRSASWAQNLIAEGLRAPLNNPTAEARPKGNSNHKRSRSVSQPPTGHVPVDQDANGNTPSSEPKGHFPASFESFSDKPQFQTPLRPDSHFSKPIRGILKSSSPVRPSSATGFHTNPLTSPSTQSSRTQRTFQLRSFSSLKFNPILKIPTPTQNSPTNPPPVTAAQTTTMSGNAAGKAKARNAAAVGPSGSTDKNKKLVSVNGPASRKKDDTSDEGSSSSDEESSDSSSDSSDEESASDSESNTPQKAATSATGNKKAAAPASESSESEESSDESDDDAPKQNAKSPAVAKSATNGAADSSSEEESDSESESESSGAKVTPGKEPPSSSTESSSEEEDSDEEMDDAPPSDQNSSHVPRPGALTAAQRAPAGPPPSSMDGGFKLQKAQNVSQIAGLLNEAKAKGDRVWLLTHPSTTPLNLDVQKVFASPENHRNSIVPNGTKLTYPVDSDGSNIHTISGCDSITVTQTMRYDADISTLAKVMSDEARHAKEAPVQPSGLRTRYLPIGVGRASPTPEDSLVQPRTEKPKKDKKKKDKKEDELSSERPSKKRKVSPAPEVETVVKKSKAESSQPAASPDEKPKKKKKSKDTEEETPVKAKKSKVKFADDTPRSSTPIPPPAIPGSQPVETPTKKGKKKRRLSEGEESGKKEKADKKGKKEWERPEGVKVTPVAPPTVPGMR